MTYTCSSSESAWDKRRELETNSRETPGASGCTPPAEAPAHDFPNRWLVAAFESILYRFTFGRSVACSTPPERNREPLELLIAEFDATHGPVRRSTVERYKAILAKALSLAIEATNVASDAPFRGAR